MIARNIVLLGAPTLYRICAPVKREALDKCRLGLLSRVSAKSLSFS